MGTAVSVFNTALYIGGGVASLNVPLMMEYGWRFDFTYMGYLGIAIGVLGLLLLQDESVVLKEDAQPQIEAEEEKISEKKKKKRTNPQAIFAFYLAPLVFGV